MQGTIEWHAFIRDAGGIERVPDLMRCQSGRGWLCMCVSLGRVVTSALATSHPLVRLNNVVENTQFKPWDRSAADQGGKYRKNLPARQAWRRVPACAEVCPRKGERGRAGKKR